MTNILPEKVLSTIHRLSFPRSPWASGTMFGESLSRQSGSSMEFQDYREYEPGDDFRTIDWAIFRRTGKLFVKVHADEKSRPITVLVDESTSMTVGRPAKQHVARQLTAAFGYIALRGGDEFQHGRVTDTLTWPGPVYRGRRHIVPLWRTLQTDTPPGTTRLAGPLTELARQRQQTSVRNSRDLTVVISDMLDPQWSDAVTGFGLVPGDKVLIHLLAPEDVSPTGAGAFRLVDSETEATTDVMLDRGTLDVYTRALNEWITSLQTQCQNRHIAYFGLNSASSLTDVLFHTFREGGLLV